MNDTQLLERFRRLQAYVGWSEEDERWLRRLRPVLEPHFHSVIDDFYDAVDSNEETRRLMTGGPTQVERLKCRLREWLDCLLSNEHDEDYVRNRWRVGLKHVEIGMAPQFTIVAMARLRGSLTRVLRDCWPGDQNSLVDSLASLNRALDLDSVLIEDAYQYEYQQRLQSRNRLVAIGQMAAGIAHELRNPLNVVRTSLFYLKAAPNAGEAKRTEHMERMERQIVVADSVITALSDFARLPLPRMTPVDVRELVCDSVQQSNVPDGVQVDDANVDPGLSALGDSRQLTIVLGNLVRNAVEAMSGQGQLRLAARRADHQIEVLVEDTGPGIPLENLPHVFDPFFTTKTRGIGLGLAITRAIVENHGGSLQVANVEGRGARFVVRLRAASDVVEPNVE